MSQRRWYNSHLPQTLVIAQLLLYIDAAFLLFDAFLVGADQQVAYSTVGKVLMLLAIGLSIYGAQGIANEKKLGYQVALAASFMPLISRAVIAAQAGGIFNNLRFIFLSNSILNVVFEYALIALLIHPMSKDHQKVWFS